MLTRCPLIVAVLSGALLLAVAGTAGAQESDPELWLQRFGPEMTARLSNRIERDTCRRLVPIVEGRLLAAARPGAVSARPPPASLALAVDSERGLPAASQTSMSCVARGASSFTCVVRPVR